MTICLIYKQVNINKESEKINWDEYFQNEF